MLSVDIGKTWVQLMKLSSRWNSVVGILSCLPESSYLPFQGPVPPPATFPNPLTSFPKAVPPPCTVFIIFLLALFLSLPILSRLPFGLFLYLTGVSSLERMVKSFHCLELLGDEAILRLSTQSIANLSLLLEAASKLQAFMVMVLGAV